MSTFNPNPWVIVAFPGTDEEELIADFPTIDRARQEIRVQHYWDCDIMKRLDDGTLTTEF